jgi:hypothetical protein
MSHDAHTTLNVNEKYYLSSQLNGSHIGDIITSVSLKLDDDTKIIAFYSGTSGHGYIVFKDSYGGAYKSHLVGIPGDVYIETSKTTWKPNAVKVYSSNKSTAELKSFFDKQMSSFKKYNSINNNCVTFAQNLGIFLSQVGTF